MEEEEECLYFDADSSKRDSVIHQKENTTDERKTFLGVSFFSEALHLAHVHTCVLMCVHVLYICTH